MEQTYSRLASVIIDGVQSGKEKTMSRLMIVEVPSYSSEFKGIREVAELIRCKECKHRPVKEDADGGDWGFNVIAPNRDERCPCLVEDGWYSWMPKDNFFCGYGERREQ